MPRGDPVHGVGVIGNVEPRLASSSRNRTAPDPAASGGSGSRRAALGELGRGGDQRLPEPLATRRVKGGEGLAAAGVQDGEAAPLAGTGADRPSPGQVHRACRRRSPAGRCWPPGRARSRSRSGCRRRTRARARPRAGRPRSQPPAASAARSTSASSAVECRGLPSAREPEQRLVEHLAAARRADGGVGGRRVEADDRHRAARSAQPVTVKTKEPTRLPSTNQLTRCLPGMLEVILLT